MALTKITGEGVGAVDTISVDGGTIKLDGNYPTGTNNVALGDTALDDGSLSGGNNTASVQPLCLPRPADRTIRL